MKNGNFKSRFTVVFMALVITFGFVFFSIPQFISHENISQLLTRIRSYQTGDVIQPDGSDEDFDDEDDDNHSIEIHPTTPGDNSNDNSNNSNSKPNSSGDDSSIPNNPSKPGTTYTVILYGNGAKVSEAKTSCTTSGGSCQVHLPSIISDRTILGFSADKNAHSASYQVGQTIQITRDEVLYAITRKDVTAYVYGNGAYEDFLVKNCSFYNEEESCSITLPSLNHDYYTSYGFNMDPNSEDILYQEGATIAIRDTQKYYAIRKINTASYQQYSAIAQEVFQKINESRKSAGVMPLQWSKSLELSSMLRVSEVAQNYDYHVNGDYHRRISNGQPFYTVNDLAYGENYHGKPSCDAASFHNDFMNSSSHKSNILNSDYDKVGISMNMVNGQCYIVELFG